MGVLNVTPDSFSDGGLYRDPRRAIEHGLALATAGADLIDVGGESTRPGAAAPGVAEELDRVIPVVEGLRSASDILISVDTSEPAVMAAAVAAGADMLNDVRALVRPGALPAAAAAGVPVCLMHMQGTPATMQRAPRYDDVVAEVVAFLMERAAACIAAGLPRESLILDPGFGFGKALEHNLALLQRLDALVATGFPVLAGLSRKSMIGQLAGEAGGLPADRTGGSLALALVARARGARIVRVHDVAPTVQAFRVMDGLESGS
ncbi:MAG: dihydropteroate synthase [Gammaproteobacteria bacterium]|nr:dihydropteroate synthase [Gammaproteobacteria bacterium]